MRRQQSNASENSRAPRIGENIKDADKRTTHARTKQQKKRRRRELGGRELAASYKHCLGDCAKGKRKRGSGRSDHVGARIYGVALVLR